MSRDPLDAFSPPVRDWFQASFAEPTAAQAKGWPAIAHGDHSLILAPTGSGKTLAAFLWAIDRLSAEPPPDRLVRTRVLYISPLRALAVDVEKNLRAPMAGIQHAAERAGAPLPHVPTVGVRTGDTSARDRRALLSRPPDILITTPESLYLMLTSSGRETLREVRWVIVDEIHALAATKRGAHLALSLERLEQLCETPPQRIGLSATQRPLEEIARFLGGFAGPKEPRPVTIVDAGHRKTMELQVVVPVEDMAELGTQPVPVDPMHDSAERHGSVLAPPPAAASIWPSIHPKLLELIREHRSTIIFVNARRLAERLAAQLNELAGEDLVKSHHGSLAREQRLEVEDALKSGALRGLVATSSLELGIDMGAVDLVIQVESPGSVASGLQRIGRAGHSVGEPSKGRIFPKYRGDLLEASVVAERMLAGLIEETRYPRNPLDVLAQQLVAMCAVDEWTVDNLRATARRCANFSDLGDDVFEAVLDLLSGRYPSDGFAELRPRLVWDRGADTVRAREGAGRIAITNGGTIPDRGLFGVFLPDGTRVGELDEEMVYESRRGEVFLLGASAWRIEDITRDQVIVAPAPGEPGKMPFWKGGKPGRPIELGRAIGAFTRELRGKKREEALARLGRDIGLDELAAQNLVNYLDDQREATGAVPDDRTVVIERFRDELGDWRMCVLTPFGSRVHAPWALAIEARLNDRLGPGAQVLWSDDGIVVRLPEAVDRIPVEDLVFEPEEIEAEVVRVLPGTAMFASVFREASARALLLPRLRPGKRTPLWQQRQRSADLLIEAAKHPTFPILLEATRECLRDVFDVPALREVMGDLRSRKTRLVTVDTETASPFAQSLLFRWVAVYMYEGDAPLAERRATALALDGNLLRELLGTEELRELLDPRALDEVELGLQRLSEGRRTRHADDVHDLLRDLGPMRQDEVLARSGDDAPAWISRLLDETRAIRVRIAGEEHLAASEDAATLRDALGASLPLGLPRAFTGPTERPLDTLVARFARTHGPFLVRDVATRLGAPPERVRQALATLAQEGRVVEGEFRPGGVEREWCDVEVLRRIRQRSLAALRKQVEPVDAATFARFLPAWQTADRPHGGVDALPAAIARLQGASVPASILETDVLPARVRGFRPADLDALCALGELVWIGAGPLGIDDGRVTLLFRDQVPVLAPAVGELPPDDMQAEIHDAIRSLLGVRGASFWPDLVGAAGTADERVVLRALWDLVWAGEVTNDTLAPLRAFVKGGSSRVRASRPGHRPRPGSLRHVGPPAGAGRWSLVATLREPAPAPTELAHARALQLLDRHGVVTRESVLAEGVPGGFSGVYPVLKALDEAGKVRRGYFVAGLGAAQFALPGSVDRLRSLRDSGETGTETPLVLAAADPAQPYGAALPWPEGLGHPSRTAGAYVVLVEGVPAAFLEGGARSLVTFGAEADRWVDTLASLVKDGRLRKIELTRIDGGPAGGSKHAAALRHAGFVDGYRGLRLRA
ncbi:MAG: DEAD/DEAH box helicase [Actinomycetota bacterium]|nr:DEAD/DEAH box helicase [Actinomycetota bacterium]